MSYEKVQNISVKKDGTISITSASSNVFPTHYTTNKLDGTKENLKVLLDDLMGGSLKFNFSSKSKVRLAFNRTVEYMKENYNNLSTWEYYVLNTNEDAFYNKEWLREDIETINSKLNKIITYEDAQKIVVDIFSYFSAQVEITRKEKINDNLFYCLMKEGYLHKITKYGYQYTAYKGNKFNEAQALEVKRMYPNVEIQRA